MSGTAFKFTRRVSSRLSKITYFGIACLVVLGASACDNAASAQAEWEAMTDADLLHELRRAQVTGSMKMLSCVREGDETACDDADAIVADVAGMEEIYCGRQPGTEDCQKVAEFQENIARMQDLRELASGVGAAAEDLTSYEAR